MPHIFISYSRKNIDFVQKIVDNLMQNNLEPWIDWKSIPKGEFWKQEIERGIEEADAFLFLVSPDSVQTQWCKDEIEHAVKNNKRIIPIVIRDTEKTTIHPEINKRNWIFCRRGIDNFDKAMEELQTAINTNHQWLKFHTRLQTKSLEWEHTKDEGRLLRGKELQEAEQQLAVIGTQNDPQPTELQRAFISASRKKSNRRKISSRIFTISFLLIAMIACISGAILFDHTPASINVNGNFLEIRNRFNYRFFNQDIGSSISNYIEPQLFITPEGKHLVMVGTDTDGERPGTVLVYDMEGHIQWEYTFDYDPYFGPPGNFQIRHIYVDEILGNGKLQFVVTAQKSDWFPSELVLLDSGGNLLDSYWNPGFIYDVLNQDLNGDGVKEIIVSSVNNNLGQLVVNDASKHPITLFVLTPNQRFTGQAFPDLIPNLKVGTEYNDWIAVFEPYVVGRIELRSTKLNGENLIEIVFSPQGGYIWMDAYGRIRKVGLSDYWQTQQGGKSPSEFLCFLTHDGDNWFISNETDTDSRCPWFAGN